MKQQEKQRQKPKSVQVLLSSYYGERYLPAQLDSLLSQKGVQVSVLVRDDGSCDRTRHILRNYAQKHTNLSAYSGQNLGTAKSFFHLLAHAGHSYSYYAFADQDDVWLEEKLARAVSCLEKMERKYPGRPLLYASNVIYASKDLRIQQALPSRDAIKPSFGNALTENICIGCTQVFNQKLLELVRNHLPDGAILHDWWMYLTAAYFGSVYYDPNAYILYRQHEGNQIGMQKNAFARWKNRVLHFGGLRHKLSGQAALFRYAYAGLLEMDTPNQRNAYRLGLLCAYRADYKKRRKLVFDQNIHRQRRLDDLAYRILFLTGYL